MQHSSRRPSNELYVVWYGSSQGWRPSKPMVEHNAEIHAESLQHEGYQTRIHPQLRVTQDDLIEG